MQQRQVFTRDDVRDLRSHGFLVITHREPNFVRKRATILFDGLEAIEADASVRKVFFDGRPNKKHGRLVQGYFEKPEDAMAQFNFESFADDRINEYRRNVSRSDFDPFFGAFEELNRYARTIIEALARVLDNPLVREHSEYKIADLLTDATTITSVTKYRAKAGTSQTSAMPNTAAGAFYWLVEDNPGMQILGRHGQVVDVSVIETDPSKGIFVPGDNLSLVTENMIEASLHPIIPQKEGEMRPTLRTFVYFKHALMERLKRKQESVNDILRG